MGTTTDDTDFVGRALLTPDSDARDYMGRAIADGDLDFLGRATVETGEEPEDEMTVTLAHSQRAVNHGISGGSGDYTSTSFTTNTDTLLVAVLCYEVLGTYDVLEAALPTPTTTGLTWIKLASRYPASSFARWLEIWVADNASAGSKTIAQSGSGLWDTSICVVDMFVAEFTGAAAAAAQDGATVSNASAYAASDPGAQTLTLSPAPSATSTVIAAAGSLAYSDTAYTITAGADFTELDGFSNGNTSTGPQSVTQAQYRADSTSATVAWLDLQAGGSGSNTYMWTLVAAEIVAA